MVFFIIILSFQNPVVYAKTNEKNYPPFLHTYSLFDQKWDRETMEKAAHFFLC